MEINYFKVLGLIGLLASELTIAARDGKITGTEGIKIISNICEGLGFTFDSGVVSLIDQLLPEIEKAQSDNRIIFKEAIRIMTVLCQRTGIELIY